MQAYLSVGMCKKFQQFKNRKTIYGHLPPKLIAALKLCNLVSIDLVGTYYKLIRQWQPGDAIIKKYVRFTHMTMIDPDTG